MGESGTKHGEPGPKKAVHNAGAFYSAGTDGTGMIPVPMTTLSDEYHDEPAEPQDSDRVPDPEPQGQFSRLIDRLMGRGSH